MIVRWIDTRTKQWECCGHIWQLIMSKLYPKRWAWNPVCPTCGTTFDPMTGAFTDQIRR